MYDNVLKFVLEKWRNLCWKEVLLTFPNARLFGSSISIVPLFAEDLVDC